MYENPVLFPQITNREGWLQTIRIFDDDTGDLIALVDESGNAWPSGTIHPNALAQQLLADIDAARANKRDMAGSRRDTLKVLEGRLASITPVAEGDVFILMGRLNDKALAAETRESIADNLGRAAPYTVLRNLRVQEWIAAREASVTNSRRERTEVDKSVNRAIDLVTVAQAALNSTAPSGLMLNVSNVLGNVLSELETATLFLSISDSVLDEPLPLLNDLWMRDQTEVQLFAEAQASTVQ